MRVIAGLYRGRHLKSPSSLEVRPTSDRLRETLFNVLAPRIEGARFLDLCAGSGAVGIEALSRGAAFVTFVEQSRKIGDLIESNLNMCCVAQDQFQVIVSEAAKYLMREQQTQFSWDVIYFDPPYASSYGTVLGLLGNTQHGLLSTNSLVIAEHHHKEKLVPEIGALARFRVLKQGDSVLSFYKFGLENDNSGN